MITALEKTAIYRTHLKHLTPDSLDRYLKEVRRPIMSRKRTLELVKEDRVEYLSDGKIEAFVFRNGTYESKLFTAKNS